MMIQFSNGGAQFFIGKGVSKDKQLGPVLGGTAGAHYVDAAAKAYGVPVVLNTDHCAKKLLPWVDGLLAASEEQFLICPRSRWRKTWKHARSILSG